MKILIILKIVILFKPILFLYFLHRMVWYKKTKFSIFFILIVHLINLIIIYLFPFIYNDYFNLNIIGKKILKSFFISCIIILYFIILFLYSIFIFIINRKEIFNIKEFSFFEESGFLIFNTFFYNINCAFFIYWISLIIKNNSNFFNDHKNSLMQNIILIIIIIFIFYFIIKKIPDKFFQIDPYLNKWIDVKSNNYSQFKSDFLMFLFLICLYFYIFFIIYILLICIIP